MRQNDAVGLIGGAIVAEVLASGMLFSAHALASWMLGKVRSLDGWLAVLVAGAWIASLEFHVLSAARAFSVGGALLAVGSTSALAWWLGPARPFARWARDGRGLRRIARRVAQSPYRLSVAASVLAASIVILHALLLPPLGWDSLTYHAVKAAVWVQHGGSFDLVGPGVWSLYRDFWAGAEVLTAWAMLPFHADTLAMAMQALDWLLLGLAVVVLARELGVREPFASSVALFVLMTPTLRMQVGTGYVELPGAAFLTSGLALGAAFLRRREGGLLVLAGAALGLASGVKLPFAPVALAALAWLLGSAVAWSADGTGRRFGAAVGALASFILAVLPWLWHAYLTSGAPFSPVPVKLGGIVLGSPTPEIEAYLARPIPPRTFGVEAAGMIDVLLRGYESPGFAAFAVMVLGVVSWPRLLRRHRTGALLVACALVTTALVYFSSGLAVARHYWPSSSVRFLVLPITVLPVLAVVERHREGRSGRVFLWLLWSATLVSFGRYLGSDVSARSAAGIAALFGCLAGFELARRWARGASPMARLALTVAGGLGFLALAGSLQAGMRGELARLGFARAPVEPYWLQAALLVDDPARPLKIAFTSGPWVMADNWFVYPFLGRRLQNEALYVPVSRDGAMLPFGSPETNERYERSADASAWLARLRASAVSTVVSFSPPSVELGWMEERPDVFERLAGAEGDWGMFAVRGAVPSRPGPDAR